MLTSLHALLILTVTALLSAAAGLLYTARLGDRANLEEYVTARGRIGGVWAGLTLFASGMGAWILFSPAEVGAVFGVTGLLGYAVGSIVPLLLYIVLGQRMRRLMPEGHTLPEYVWHRYGPRMYALTLVVAVFYMFVFLAAEVTGMALLMQMIAGIPLWITAVVVLAATLAYVTAGGLRASIFTDVLQSVVILPALAVLVVAALLRLGDPAALLGETAAVQPQLLRWGHAPGLEQALTLVIAIAAANLFHQGYWQRVYAARDGASLRRGFLLAAVLILPIVFVLGAFGLAAVGRGQAEPASVALFTVLLDVMPVWGQVGLLVLAVLLVMSSADTLLNAMAGMVAVDLHRLLPGRPPAFLLRAARWSTVVLALPVAWIAAQGYSVLYLFLLADMVCAAAVFPVFFGLYSVRFDARAALWATLVGLAAGAVLFPDPAFTRGSLFWSVTAALGVSVIAALLLRPRRPTFGPERLGRDVHVLEEPAPAR